ncbi:MAG: hypothetical protein PWQ77_543 [Kosmotogales bacterium]|nr:hypothetical protein [Kosmotogales bacterium]
MEIFKILLNIKGKLPITKPENIPYVNEGLLSSEYLIKKEKANIAVNAPIIISKRKMISSFLNLKLVNEEIELINLSYIPPMRAIVPPLTPGIKFAIPINAPIIML